MELKKYHSMIRKKNVDVIDEKYVDQNKPENGNVHNREDINDQIWYFRSSAKHKKKFVWSSPQKKKFSCRGKQIKTNKNFRTLPPDI